MSGYTFTLPRKFISNYVRLTREFITTISLSCSRRLYLHQFRLNADTFCSSTDRIEYIKNDNVSRIGPEKSCSSRIIPVPLAGN